MYLLGPFQFPFIFPDSYDALAACGTFIPGHMKYDALPEMIRCVKPGIRNCSHTLYLRCYWVSTGASFLSFVVSPITSE